MEFDKVKDCKFKVENEGNGGSEMTEREKKLLVQYRKLCEENKVTIEILIKRLLGQEKGRE